MRQSVSIVNVKNHIQALEELKSKIDDGHKLALLEKPVRAQVEGVLVAMRHFGKIAFGKLQSTYGNLQIMFNTETVFHGEATIKQVLLGCHLQVFGQLALTSTREPTLFLEEVTLLQVARQPFPDKFNGISEEQKRKLRFLDCLVNQDQRSLILKRSAFISSIRQYLNHVGFLEVETPILHKVACGAAARNFVTSKSHATDEEYVLRIAPETYLKRMTAGGFQKVYEIGKQFRNEGQDPTHMPEFTSCEWYEAYTNYEDQMLHFCSLLDWLERRDGFQIKQNSILVEHEFSDLWAKHELPEFSGLKASEIDHLFKEHIRPTLQDACFVKNYPAKLVPLAKRRNDNPEIAEMWQFIWKGQEIAKCYTELVDPVEQRKLLEEQAASRSDGDGEAMELDDAFLQAMEFGMPPQAGLGFGVDRLFALYMEVDDIRDTTFFPFGV